MAEAVINCGICNTNHISRPADIWCQQCDEGLCSGCQYFHNASKFTSSHNTIPVTDYRKLPSDILQITDVCSEHNEKLIMYCHNHLQPCCRTCSLENHNSCTDLAKIESVIQNYKSSVALRDLEISLKDSNANVTKLKEDRKNNLKSIAADTEDALKEIENIRRKINQHLDKLQERITKELKQKENGAKSTILNTITLLDKEESFIRHCLQTLSDIKSYASDLQAFLYTTNIEEQVNTTENRLLELFKGGACSTSKINVQIDTRMKTFANDMTCFGRVEVDTAPSSVVLKRQKEGEAQMFAHRSQARRIENINLSVDKTIDKKGELCFGCSFISDGRMILTKYDAKWIRVLDTNGSEELSIKAPGYPSDVAHVDDTTLAVSCFDLNNKGAGIKTIDIKTGKKMKTFLSGHSIDGITALDENHIIYCEKGIGVRMIRINDEIVTDIVKDRKLPYNCYVTAYGNSVIYTNNITNTVACHDVNGTLKWSFRDEDIMSGPRGVTTDKYGNVFVAGFDSENIVIISANGEKQKQVGSDVTKILARNLDYDKINDRLLVTSEHGECVVMKLV